MQHFYTSGYVSVEKPLHLSPQPGPRTVGITHNFRINWIRQCQYCPLSSSKKNLQSASEHPEVIDEYLLSELQESRVAGPFTRSAIPAAHISRFGVIQKSHQQWWLAHR